MLLKSINSYPLNFYYQYLDAHNYGNLGQFFDFTLVLHTAGARP